MCVSCNNTTIETNEIAWLLKFSLHNDALYVTGVILEGATGKKLGALDDLFRDCYFF